MNLVENKLAILHADAKKDVLRIGKGIAKSIFRPIQPKDFEQAYLPISKKQGRVIRDLIIERNCKNIIEFGTSFGISTLFLAQGVLETGGYIITTELIETKALKAIENFKLAGVSDLIEGVLNGRYRAIARLITQVVVNPMNGHLADHSRCYHA